MSKIHYVVEPLDVDGDNIPDGDLVKQYKGNKLISQKFVAYKKLKKIADNAIKQTIRQPSVRKERMLYKRIPTPQQQVNRVIVQDDTSLGQYLKAGFGLDAGGAVGNAVGEAVVDGFASGFDALFGE